MRIITETATVYRVPGERRFFTRSAAYRRLASSLIRAKYWERDLHEDRWGGTSPGLDLEFDYSCKLKDRLARYLRWVDSRAEVVR